MRGNFKADLYNNTIHQQGISLPSPLGEGAGVRPLIPYLVPNPSPKKNGYGSVAPAFLCALGSPLPSYHGHCTMDYHDGSAQHNGEHRR